MNNYRGDGLRWPKTVPTGGATKGDVYVIVSGASGKCGVWIDTYAAAARGVLQVRGVVELTKQTGTGTGFTQGQVVYWDDSSNRVEAGATSNTRLGRVVEAVSTSATTVKVQLNDN